jgi:arginine-tRNA-protein transferase
MLILRKFTTEPHACAYLPGRTAELEYSIAPLLEEAEYESLMNRGYRKFGFAFYRPVCQFCSKCQAIRFPVDEFRPDRSQRRALKRNADLEVRFGPPECDAERLALFERYHLVQHVVRQWPQVDENQEDYEARFVQNSIPTTEISLWENGVLRGVLIAELTANVISAVYHYYDPDFRERGLGTFLVLQCVELALRTNRRWVYLGYYVAGCASMEYKTRFKPSEVLADKVWRRMQ